MRMACVLLAALICALLGFDASRRLKNRVTCLASWLRALEWMDVKLTGEGIPLREVVRKEGEGEVTKRLNAFSRALQDNPRLSAAQAWASSGKDQNTPEDAVLAQCFASLGTGTLEKRRTAVMQAMEQLRVIRKEAEGKAEKDCRLYKSMGLLGGAALLLILL